jgi:hypothetical protein
MITSTIITFSEHSATQLKRTFEFRGLPVPEIISLNDDLRAGPLSGIDTPKGNDNRREWWSTITAQTYDRNRVELFINDFDKLEQIKGLLENNQRICIWYGSCLFDKLMMARLIAFCGPLSETFSVVPISEFTITTKNGKQYVPRTMDVLDDENIIDLESSVRQITMDEVNEATEMWEHVSSNNASMCIFKDNRVEFVEENYFDSALMSNCSNEFIKPARVVGYTLIDTDFNVSDTILNWRLKELVGKNRMEAKGILRDMRDYEVRIPR